MLLYISKFVKYFVLLKYYAITQNYRLEQVIILALNFDESSYRFVSIERKRHAIKFSRDTVDERKHFCRREDVDCASLEKSKWK